MADWIMAHTAAAYFAPVALVFGGARLVEVGLGLHTRSRPWLSRWFPNLTLGAINFAMAAVLPLGSIAAAVWAESEGVGLANAREIPLAATIILALLLRGLIVFWVHLALHKVPLLWRIHRVHHLDTECDISTSFRTHPVEMLMAVASNVVVVIALGIPAWLMVILEVVDIAVAITSHADVDLPDWLETVLGRLVITPRIHRIHHSAYRPETDSNYGTTIPLWDMVFGTFRPRPTVPVAQMQLGLEDPRGPEVDSLSWLLRAPWMRGANEGRDP
jgi:sterol desaturase/sphingolipid hydroxylase (fatty acid hydroxylase superfamily)